MAKSCVSSTRNSKFQHQLHLVIDMDFDNYIFLPDYETNLNLEHVAIVVGQVFYKKRYLRQFFDHELSQILATFQNDNREIYEGKDIN